MTQAGRAALFLAAIYLGFGLQLPYLPAWLDTVRGLSGTQVALTVFGASLGRILTGPLIAAWAENRTGRAALMQLSLGVTAGFVALWASPGPATLIAAGFATLTLLSSTLPIAESLLILSSSQGGGGFSFARGRAAGSVSFVAGVFLGGMLKDALGVAAVVPAAIACFTLTIGMAAMAPDLNLGKAGMGLGLKERLRRGLSLYRRPLLILLLSCCGCLVASHSFYYGFSVVIWEAQGWSGTTTSALWSTGVMVEIALFAFASRLPVWVTPQRLILAGAAGAVIRWSGLSQSPDLAPAFLLQALHGLSFAAVYLGMVETINREVPTQDKTAAMSVQYALTSGLFSGVSGLLSGPLYDAWGVKGYLAMAALSGFGLVFALGLMFRIATRPQRENYK